MQVAITYTVVDPEISDSIEDGWLVEYRTLSLRDTIDVFLSAWDGREPIEPSCHPLCAQEHCWLTACDHIDDEHMCYGFHIKDVTMATRNRIFRLIQG